MRGLTVRTPKPRRDLGMLVGGLALIAIPVLWTLFYFTSLDVSSKQSDAQNTVTVFMFFLSGVIWLPLLVTGIVLLIKSFGQSKATLTVVKPAQCKGCGAHFNGQSGEFCVTCEPVVYGAKFCAACGSSRLATDKFCQSCGTRFS